MKKPPFRTLSLVAALLVLPVTNTTAQTTNEECTAVLRAAQSGRETANSRIAQAEAIVKDRVAAARKCLENFGDVTARTTVSVGGFDLTPLRDRFFNSACNVIQGQLTKAQADLQREVAAAQGQIQSQAQSLLSRPVTDAGSYVINNGLSTPGINGVVAPNTTSTLDQIACKLFGRC